MSQVHDAGATHSPATHPLAAVAAEVCLLICLTELPSADAHSARDLRPRVQARWSAVGAAGLRRVVARAWGLSLVSLAAAVNQEEWLWAAGSAPGRDSDTIHFFPFGEGAGETPEQRAGLRRELVYACGRLLDLPADLADEAALGEVLTDLDSVWPPETALSDLALPMAAGEITTALWVHLETCEDISASARRLLSQDDLLTNLLRYILYRELAGRDELPPLPPILMPPADDGALQREEAELSAVISSLQQEVIQATQAFDFARVGELVCRLQSVHSRLAEVREQVAALTEEQVWAQWWTERVIPLHAAVARAQGLWSGALDQLSDALAVLLAPSGVVKLVDGGTDTAHLSDSLNVLFERPPAAIVNQVGAPKREYLEVVKIVLTFKEGFQRLQSGGNGVLKHRCDVSLIETGRSKPFTGMVKKLKHRCDVSLIETPFKPAFFNQIFAKVEKQWEASILQHDLALAPTLIPEEHQWKSFCLLASVSDSYAWRSDILGDLKQTVKQIPYDTAENPEGWNEQDRRNLLILLGKIRSLVQKLQRLALVLSHLIERTAVAGPMPALWANELAYRKPALMTAERTPMLSIVDIQDMDSGLAPVLEDLRDAAQRLFRDVPPYRIAHPERLEEYRKPVRSVLTWLFTRVNAIDNVMRGHVDRARAAIACSLWPVPTPLLSLLRLIDPLDPDMLAQQFREDAVVILTLLGYPTEAMALGEQLVAQDPDNLFLRHNLALLYLWQADTLWRAQ